MLHITWFNNPHMSRHSNEVRKNWYCNSRHQWKIKGVFHKQPKKEFFFSGSKYEWRWQAPDCLVIFLTVRTFFKSMKILLPLWLVQKSKGMIYPRQLLLLAVRSKSWERLPWQTSTVHILVLLVLSSLESFLMISTSLSLKKNAILCLIAFGLSAIRSPVCLLRLS